jgi:aspartate/tyrosine/aromatic aminotransferase
MFQDFPLLPLDPIFQLQADFLADQNPNKVNLGIGLYADEKGNPVVLDSVKKAFNQVDTSNFNYQPISGNPSFLKQSANFIFNDANINELALQATCGGTQALRMFADLAEKEFLQNSEQPALLVATPTWSNHLAIFKNFKTTTFNHLNSAGLACLESYQNALEAAPHNAVLLLHGGKTHNPSGQNLSLSQFLFLSDLINSKNIKVLIDSAYFGFGDDFEAESSFLTTLKNAYNNFAVAFSFSKNASLYEHRTGVLLVKTSNKKSVESQLQQLARESVSMAPGLGQDIMANILENYFQEWQSEVKEIRNTLNQNRKILADRLPPNFAHLAKTAGMFGLLPFTPDQNQSIRNDFAVYFPNNGRINIAGINPSNLDYIIKAFTS